MKHIFFIIIFLFSTGCSIFNTLGQQPKHTINLTEAIYYVGLNENIDRVQLKRFLNVDPVTTEWCAAFINAVLARNNISNLHDFNSKRPLLAQEFLNYGEIILEEELRYGDIIIIERDGAKWQGHVGFFMGIRHSRGQKYYLLLGGNQNNKVSIAPYSSKKLIGMRRYSNYK